MIAAIYARKSTDQHVADEVEVRHVPERHGRDTRGDRGYAPHERHRIGQGSVDPHRGPGGLRPYDAGGKSGHRGAGAPACDRVRAPRGLVSHRIILHLPWRRGVMFLVLIVVVNLALYVWATTRMP
jgi:hypothetical protein